MLKKILALVAMLYAAACFAAVDVNKANATELDSVKGIGPAMSQRILDERKKGKFKSWDDLIARVKGLGEVSAGKLSAEGLTVSGDAYKTAAATDKKDAAKATAKEEKAAAKEAKATAKEEKTAAKDAKATVAAKDEKKETKAAAKEEKKEAKAEVKTAAKEEKKDDKAAAAAKPAASAKK